VGKGALTLWSFLMASAHGAGLMVVPVFLAMTATDLNQTHHHGMQMAAATPASAVIATVLHATGYLRRRDWRRKSANSSLAPGLRMEISAQSRCLSCSDGVCNST
jgi:hypothetical protein